MGKRIPGLGSGDEIADVIAQQQKIRGQKRFRKKQRKKERNEAIAKALDDAFKKK